MGNGRGGFLAHIGMRTRDRTARHASGGAQSQWSYNGFLTLKNVKKREKREKRYVKTRQKRHVFNVFDVFKGLQCIQQEITLKTRVFNVFHVINVI